MEVKINREKLLEGVQKVQGIVEVKGALPILSYLLITTDNQGIHIQATDLEIGTKGFYEANIISEGHVALNARKLHDILRELPNEEVHFCKEENHWVTIKCGKSVFRLPGMPAEDFPPFPEFSKEPLIQFHTLLWQILKVTPNTPHNSSFVFSFGGDYNRCNIH